MMPEIEHRYYVLRFKTPHPVDDVMTWASEFEKSNRIVEQTDLKDYFVSTVFLGVPANIFKSERPQLFETMIFDRRRGPLDGYQDRSSTWEEAEANHKRALRLVRWPRIAISLFSTVTLIRYRLTILFWKFKRGGDFESKRVPRWFLPGLFNRDIFNNFLGFMRHRSLVSTQSRAGADESGRVSNLKGDVE